MNWYIQVLKNYATFSGRARRKEYWMFTLINLVVFIILSILDGALGMITESGLGILSGIYSLATLLPAWAVCVRRLHDTNRTGWWMLISIIPLIGFIVLLVFMCLDSKSEANKYGDATK